MTDAATRKECWSAARADVLDYFAPGVLLQLAELRWELFLKYLGGITEVSEFGGGLGHNLLPLLNTGRRLRAFDWSRAAVRRCTEAGLEGAWFDMLDPDPDVKIGGAVLTVHAMEQLGEAWWPFLQFLRG